MQIVSDKFHQIFAGSWIEMDWRAKLSFERNRNREVKWFGLNVSRLDGGDLLATPEGNPAQVWDGFDYQDLSERVIEMNIERKIDFPYNVQAGVADIKLDNSDGYFSFFESQKSPVADFILPKRPMRLYLGAKKAENVPVFVGTTEKIPKYNDNRTIEWSALDFLAEIAETPLKNTIMMRNVGTDRLIQEILRQYGMDNNQFRIGKGRLVIPFAFLRRGDNAGNILRKLVQAENGSMWLDEQGVIRFENRAGNLGKTPVMTFDEDNIIEFKTSNSDKIVNFVKIKSDVRKIQPLQPIFSADGRDEWDISVGETKTVWLNFDDPVWSLRELTIGETEKQSWVRFKKGDVVDNSGMVVKGELFADSYKLTVKNQGGSKSRIDKIELWGEAAKVVDTIEYEAFDDESVARFGKRTLEIGDNDFFGSYQNCDLFAMDILRKYSNYSPTIEMKIFGNPALQVGDVVSVNYKNGGDFLVTGTKMKLSSSGFEMVVEAKPHTVSSAFVLNKSVLDGKDLLS